METNTNATEQVVEQTPAATTEAGATSSIPDGLTGSLAEAYAAANNIEVKPAESTQTSGADQPAGEPQSTKEADPQDGTQTPEKDPPAGPDFNINDLSEADFTDPAKYERAKAYAEGFAKRDRDNQVRLLEIESAKTQLEQGKINLETSLATEEGALTFVQNLLQYHPNLVQKLGVQPGQAQNQSASDDDPLGLNAMVEAKARELMDREFGPMKEIIQTQQQQQQIQQMEQSARTEAAQVLPALNASLKASFPTVADFSVDDVIHACKTNGHLIPPTQDMAQVLQGVIKAVQLTYHDRFVPASTLPPRRAVPESIAGATQTPGVAEADPNAPLGDRLMQHLQMAEVIAKG